MLPILLRGGSVGGLMEADDHRQFETLMIQAIGELEDLLRGSRIFGMALEGGVPEDKPDGQEQALPGDLCLDIAPTYYNLWQWVDGAWVFRLSLLPRDGAAILGGPNVPDEASGKLGDWYFQHGVAAWERTGQGWVNRFALGGGGVSLPDPVGADGKFLGVSNGLAMWLATGVGTLGSLLTTAKTSAVAAINELSGQLTTLASNLGSLASLTTTAKGNLVAALNETRLTLALSTEVTTAYTLTLADAGQLVPVNSAGAVTVTVPLNSAVAFPVGTVLQIRQRGAGQVTVAGAAGVTVNAYGGLKTAGQYAEVGLHKVGADTWVLTGGVA